MIMNGRDVPAEDRKALQAHYDNTNRWLAGSGMRDVLVEVNKLFEGMKRAGPVTDATLAVYAEILCQQPLWAISRACQDFMRGKVGDGVWAPSVAELNKLCDAKTARYREDQTRIASALSIGAHR